ncbi:MAG: alpha-L-fucosidase [Planctomycetaceae bacterium]|nr:alpha-L-fucosidase [Planctomycetaceae bacterium]
MSKASRRLIIIIVAFGAAALVAAGALVLVASTHRRGPLDASDPSQRQDEPALADLTDYSPGPMTQPASASTRRANPARPAPEQLAFQDLEMGLFIHFGLDTYTDQTSGDGKKSPDLFNPTELNCDQWMQTAAAMGARYVVYTARHEGGFCTWPTASHDYSVKASSWRSGRGDVVREFTDACRRSGMKVGLYHTPSHDAYSRRVFKDDPAAYQRVQEQQIIELLSNYGPIDYLWFDHHRGSDLYRKIDALVRRLQPQCLIFGVDTWIQNGHLGVAPETLWNAVDTVDGTAFERPTSDAGTPWGRYYRVWETNTEFSGHWFWNGPAVAPVEAMIKKYYFSVGRGANFLPNFAPDPRGLMTDEVMKRAKQFGDDIRRRFATPVFVACPRGRFSTFTQMLDPPATFDHMVLTEDLHRGQNISELLAEYLDGQTWKELARVSTVGHKRIVFFKPVTAGGIRLSCPAALTDRWALERVALYLAGPGPKPVTAADEQWRRRSGSSRPAGP